MSGQSSWFELSHISYFMDKQNQSQNKWAYFFKFEANSLQVKDLEEMFFKRFGYPLIENFLCALKYWEAKSWGLETISNEELQRFKEYPKYRKCIKRVDSDKAFKILKNDITDYGIPTKWNQEFHYKEIDLFLSEKNLQSYCQIKFHKSEDFQKLQECNFLFGFIPNSQELASIINSQMPLS